VNVSSTQRAGIGFLSGSYTVETVNLFGAGQGGGRTYRGGWVGGGAGGRAHVPIGAGTHKESCLDGLGDLGGLGISTCAGGSCVEVGVVGAIQGPSHVDKDGGGGVLVILCIRIISVKRP
jgi:hypothetical protein